MYMKKTYEYGNFLEIAKYNTSNCKSPNTVRAPRIKKTTAAQSKINERNAIKDLQRIVNANFKAGDYHLTLTYNNANRTSDYKTAKSDLKKFLKKLRTLAKKHDTQLKYITITEYGTKSGTFLHHHLIINNLGVLPEVITEHWQLGYCKLAVFDNSGDYTPVANYFAKVSQKFTPDGNRISYRRWNSSRNLIHPKPKLEVISANNWKKEPAVPKGYMLIEDSLRVGVSEYTGYPYQYYKCVKIKNVERRKNNDCTRLTPTT